MSEGTPPPPPPENPYGSGGGTPPPPPPNEPPSGPGGYGAPAPPPPPPTPAGRRPGELLDRFLARLIDGILLFVVNLVILVPVVIGILGINSTGGFGMGGSFAASAVSAVLSTVIYLAYYGLMESTRGQTVGKMAMKLHVVGPTGANPTLEEAVKRNIWLGLPILGVVPIIGGLIGGLAQLAAVIMIAVGISNDPNRRPWTDKFAGTQVMKEG